MEMKIKDVFFMIELEKELTEEELKQQKKQKKEESEEEQKTKIDRWLYDTKEDGVKKLKSLLKKHTVEDVTLFEITTVEWHVKEIGWKDLVQDLISVDE